MRLAKIERGGANAEGILAADDVVRVIGGWRDGGATQSPFSLSAHSNARLKELLAVSEISVPLQSVSLAVPMDPFRKIICAGINYRDHAGEINSETPKYPVLFTRTLDSIVAHGRPILVPKVSKTLDFEGEIAIVIGRPGRHIPVAEAMSFVSGYTCFLDGSVREYQKHSLTAGKNFWQSGSMGPWITTADEVGNDIHLETRLNGAVVQSATAGQMIFGIAELISYCSRWTMLSPGDIIATGTPGGVGSRRTPPLWMKNSDRIEVDIELVGRLENPVRDE